MSRDDEEVLAEVVGRAFGELQRRIEKLEQQVLLERRLASLELRHGGADADLSFDLPNWRAEQ